MHFDCAYSINYFGQRYFVIVYLRSEEEPTPHNKQETKYVYRYIYIKITNISVCQIDLLQGNINN